MTYIVFKIAKDIWYFCQICI